MYSFGEMLFEFDPIGLAGGVNLFDAEISVTSSTTIPADEIVMFQPGYGIDLISNFEVELGALFTAEIQYARNCYS